jgi:FkbM family methyltransferase
MSGTGAHFLLRYGSRLRALRRAPVLGPMLSRVSRLIVPAGTLVWQAVEDGPAKGLWLRLNPRTGELYARGGGEPQVQAALVKLLRPGMTFYDVGANIGFFSLLAARIVGPTGRVVAFEADPENAARLRENVERNSFSWIELEEKAVWSTSGGTVFFGRANPELTPDRGDGHVVNGDQPNTISVPAMALDDYVKSTSPPDFVKVDVEGAEVEVLAGAARLLRDWKPIVLCELHTDHNRRALLGTFTDLGYVCSDCDQHHALAVPQRVRHERSDASHD